MRILIVSFYFPPYNNIAAVRIGKTAKYLVTFGHEVRVVTAKRQPFQHTLALEIPSESVRYTNWINLKKPIHMLSGGQTRIDLGDIPPGAHQAWRRSRIWSLLKTFLFFPDEQIGWLPFAVRKCAQTVKQWKPDVILASSGPMTLPPMTRILALLCRRLMMAENRSLHSAARTAGKRFAAMDMPMPVPQIRMPRGYSPEEILRATWAAKSG